MGESGRVVYWISGKSRQWLSKLDIGSCHWWGMMDDRWWIEHGRVGCDEAVGDGKSERCLMLAELELDTCWDWHPCLSACFFWPVTGTNACKGSLCFMSGSHLGLLDGVVLCQFVTLCVCVAHDVCVILRSSSVFLVFSLCDNGRKGYHSYFITTILTHTRKGKLIIP